MARSTLPHASSIYAAAQLIATEGLLKDSSAFGPPAAVWSRKTFATLLADFVNRPDLRKDVSFLKKLEIQVGKSDPLAIRLMAELVAFHLLITREIGQDKKLSIVRTILTWAGNGVTVPAAFEAALDDGLVNPGIFYNTGRDSQLAYLIRFGLAWKSLPRTDQERFLSDPWQFKNFAESVEIGSGYSQRSALLHLFFPDTFEHITSREHKNRIAESFAQYAVNAPDDIDRKLLQIREGLTNRFGPDFSFYSGKIEPLWQKNASRWDLFVHWAKRFRATPDFETQETNYKVGLQGVFARARTALLSDSEDWLPALKDALNHKDQNLIHWGAKDRFLKWAQANPVEAKEALSQLWAEGPWGYDRITRFVNYIPGTVMKGAGVRLSVVSLLLLGLQNAAYVPYRRDPFSKAHELTGTEQPPARLAEGPLYEHALKFLDSFIEEAARRKMPIADRLEAQSLVWVLTKGSAHESWSPEEQEEFRAYRGLPLPEVDEEDGSTIPADHPPTDAPAESLETMASRLLLDEEHLREVIRLLEARKQIIFYGPPGTGKTYVAREIAKYVAGSSDRVSTIQFHASYSYEDFVEGFRPRSDGNGFALRDGPLKKTALKAKDGLPRVVLIDEINRANVAKVFGELYYLLEYRGESVQLQYSDALFQLPPNVFFIGTMNTADRSIALVDAALRRRFYFVPYFPREAPLDGLLARWLARVKPELSWVATALDRANDKLGDRDIAIGPSHFMKPDLDEVWVERIWKHSVLPYIEEQLHGQRDNLKGFDLALLREEAVQQAAAE